MGCIANHIILSGFRLSTKMVAASIVITIVSQRRRIINLVKFFHVVDSGKESLKSDSEPTVSIASRLGPGCVGLNKSWTKKVS